MGDVFDSSNALASTNPMSGFARPFSDFSSACQGVTSYLKQITKFQVFAVTRFEDENMFCVEVTENDFGIKSGDVFETRNSCCAKVVSGELPKFVYDVDKFLEIELERFPIRAGAHICVPLMVNESSVFGTICALNATPMPNLDSVQVGTIEMAASMLSTILALELHSFDQRRSYERAKRESESDELTSLLNRRGWDRALLDEEALCAQFGLSASVIVIDLDRLKEINDSQGHRAGDQVIRRAAQIIEQTSRSDDVVARTGGDEFAILSKGISPQDLSSFTRRIRIALMVAGVSASVGTSTRTLQKTLTDAWTEADAAMYVSKRSKG